MDENSREEVDPDAAVGNAQDDDAGGDADGEVGGGEVGGGEVGVAEVDGEEVDGLPQFSLDVPGSKPRFDYLRMVAGVFVGLAIVGIVLFSVTDLSSLILPMEDRYLDVLLPPTEDGSEPFVLDELNQRLNGNTLSVDGRMTNLSSEPVENVMAVIRAEDTTGRFPATLEIPVIPSILAPEETGSFSHDRHPP